VSNGTGNWASNWVRAAAVEDIRDGGARSIA